MGPLSGLKVVEMVGLAPGPFCAMLLADLGAEVIRVDRPRPVTGSGGDRQIQPLARGRRGLVVDLKNPRGMEAVLKLVDGADALIEGFRPGVMERLGVGPDVCLERNSKLIYGRLTGWGQEGPIAQAAGHDINYIALAGALESIGPKGGPPVPPHNLLGDFAGGGMLLAFGILAALFERAQSGKGQVIDAAMVDGAAILTAFTWGQWHSGVLTPERGTNVLDSGAPHYNAYETADGKYISIGSIEEDFYAEMLERIGLQDPDLPDREDRANWPVLKERFAAVFKTKTRDEWCQIMEGSDACFAPVLTLEEAAQHPHNKVRNTFVEVDGRTQPAPAPRFSRTPADIPSPAGRLGQNTEEVLAGWGFSAQEIAALREAKAIL